MVERADVVVNALGIADSRTAAVAEALDDRAEDGTSVVVVREPGPPRSTQLQLKRCRVVEGPLTRRLLSDSVERG
jgi:hypothetical protein